MTTYIYEASPDFQFAAAVAEFGMLLRNSKYKGNATYADVLARARDARWRSGELPRGVPKHGGDRSLSGEAPQAIARQ